MKVPTMSTVDKSFAAINLAPSVAVVKKESQKSKIVLPKCTLRYALALSDPFHPLARGACVPVGSAPTMKTHAFARFDVTIGQNGAAYILLTPSLSNSIPSVFYTASTYNTGVVNPFTASGTVGAAGTVATFSGNWNYVQHNGPFSSGQLVNALIPNLSTSAPVTGKVVSASMRVQYTGTTLNESGLYYCYHDPAHNSLSGCNIQNLGNFGDTNVEGVSRMPCTVVSHAVSASEQDFCGDNATSAGGQRDILSILYPYSQGQANWDTLYAGSTQFLATWLDASVATGYTVPVGAPIAAIGLTGVAGQSVHVETIFHFEYQGVGAASMLTPVEPDLTGASIVRTAALTLPQAKLDNPRADNWKLMYGALEGAAHAAIPYVVPMMKAGLSALLA